MPSNYSGSNTTSGGNYTLQNNKYCGGGSGGGNTTSRSGHHGKYQQGLNNRASDLELISNISDNDHLDNPKDDLNLLAKEDFFT